MQLIAELYKGLFISQRVTKGALSMSSLGLLNHHSGQDQRSIILMCQSNTHQPFLKHVRSTRASSCRGPRDVVVCFETHTPCPGISAEPLPGQDISSLEHLEHWCGLSEGNETHPAPKKEPLGIGELVELLCCHSQTKAVAALCRYPSLVPATQGLTGFSNFP